MSNFSKRKETKVNHGEVCAICERDFIEEYGEAKACELCGGDGVLIEDDEQIWNHGIGS